MKATGSEQYEEHGIKPPKVRNLLPSKKFSDNVRKWGESSELSRRRVIIGELLHHGRRAGIEKRTQIRVVSGETTLILHIQTDHL